MKEMHTSIYPFIVDVDSEHPVEKSTLSSGEWIAKQPRAAYTTCRTFRGINESNQILIFQLAFHIHRLQQSTKLILQDTTNLSSDEIDDLIKQIQPKVIQSLQTAINNAHQNPDSLKLTILVTWNTPSTTNHTHTSTDSQTPSKISKLSIIVRIHVTDITPPPPPPIIVIIRGAPRHNPDAKDTQWVSLRKIYEESMPKDVNETILIDDGTLYEGLSSNFFIVMNDGTVHTAEEGVLKGSVRDAVLNAAKKEEIAVVLEAPSLASIDTWSAAFLCSTSRLLLPIDAIIITTNDNDVTVTETRTVHLQSRDDIVVQRLQQQLRKEMESSSENVFDYNNE